MLSCVASISFCIFRFNSSVVSHHTSSTDFMSAFLVFPEKVFSALPEEMSVPDQHVAEKKLDEVFWNICKSHYIERDKPMFPDECVYKLYRIFSMLGEMVENDDGQIEVSLKCTTGCFYSNSKITFK